MTPEQEYTLAQMRNRQQLVGDVLGGAGENVLALGTGMAAQVPAGLHGVGSTLGNLLRGRGLDESLKRGAANVERTQAALTYQPRTEAGQQGQQNIGRAVESVTEPLKETFVDPIGERSPALGAGVLAGLELVGPKGKPKVAKPKPSGGVSSGSPLTEQLALRTEPGGAQGLLPGVEPRSRQQLMAEALRQKTEALQRMDFDDKDLGISYHYSEPGWNAREMDLPEYPSGQPPPPPHMQLSGQPWRGMTRGNRPAATGRNMQNIEGWRDIPRNEDEATDYLRLRRQVGAETEQRMLAKDAELQAARENLTTAQYEHELPLALEEKAATTERIRQLREDAARTADPEERAGIERQLYLEMRQKPLPIGRTAVRAAESGPRFSVPREYTDLQGNYATIPENGLQALALRNEALQAQRQRTIDAQRLHEQVGTFVEEYTPSHAVQGQLPGWVQQLEEGAATTRTPAREDWWQQTVQQHPERFPELQPPPDPHTMNRASVAAFLQGAGENPGSLFQYGPSPESKTLKGIAQAMNKKGDDIDFEWEGRGRGPGRDANGMLIIKSGDGQINVSFENGVGHVDATSAPSDGGAVIYQILYDHARKHGYEIDSNSLYQVNKLRVLSNVLPDIARAGGGEGVRNVSGTSHGDAPAATGFAEGPEVWRAEAGSVRARVERAAPESRSSPGESGGGDPEAVRFDPERGFSIHGEAVEKPEAAIRARIKELSPGLIVGDKPSSTGVGAKTLMRRAVFDWVRHADPAQARLVAKNWKKWGPLFGVAGVTSAEVLRAAGETEETH